MRFLPEQGAVLYLDGSGTFPDKPLFGSALKGYRKGAAEQAKFLFLQKVPALVLQ